ncbi:MAG: O-antigen ligase family protein [Bacteroidota bacterium]
MPKVSKSLLIKLLVPLMMVVLVALYFDFYLIALAPVAIGLLFLCVYNPAFYVLLICFAVPLSVFVKDVGGGLGLSVPTEPMIWILFIMYTTNMLIKGEFNIRFLKMPLVMAILFNLFWMLICTFTSTMFFVSIKYFIARSWFLVTFFFFLFQMFENPAYIRRFLSYMIYGSFILVSITLVKHSGEGFARGWGYSIMEPFFTDHTIYSAYIAFFIPPAIMFALRGNWFKFNGFQRYVFAFIALVLIVGTIFSYTRASWISLIAAFLFYCIIKLKVKFRTMMIVLGAILLLGFIKQDQLLYSLEHNKQGSADDLESHAQSVSNITTDPSNLERVNRWHCAILMFRARPVFGYGPGTYTQQYAPFQRPEDLTLISTNSGDLGGTHSEYFNALSEMGLFGFLSWLAVFLLSVSLGLNIIYDETKMPWQRSLTTAVLLGLITYYVHAFLNNYSDFDKIAAPLWGFMAIMVAIKFYQPRELTSEDSK